MWFLGLSLPSRQGWPELFCGAESDLALIFLPQPRRYWDFKHGPPNQVSGLLLNIIIPCAIKNCHSAEMKLLRSLCLILFLTVFNSFKHVHLALYLSPSLSIYLSTYFFKNSLTLYYWMETAVLLLCLLSIGIIGMNCRIWFEPFVFFATLIPHLAPGRELAD